MDRKIIKSFAFNMAYQVLIILLPIATTPYISRCLGVDNVGIFSFTSSVVSYFALFITFGFHIYGQKEIAKNQNRKDVCSQLFYEIQIRKLIVTSIVLIIFCCFVSFQKKYILEYLIQSLSLLAVLFDISFMYQGLELYDVTFLRNGIVKLIGFICIFVFVHDSSDIYMYILITCLVTLIGNISLWINLGRYISYKHLKKFSLFKDIKTIFELFIPFIAIQLYFNIDKTMLGILFDTPTENGYYEQAIKIIRLCSTVIAAIGAVLVSSISRMIIDKDIEKIQDTIQKSIGLGLFIACPMAFGLMGISDVFVPFFFGNGYEKVSSVLLILTPILLFTSISNTIGNGILVTTNRHNYISLAAAIGAICNIILNALLIPKFMSIGAAFASVVAEIIVLVVQWYFARDYLITKSIMLYLLKYVFSGLIMYFSLLAVKGILIEKISIPLLMLLLIFVGFFSYFILLIIEKDSFVLNILKSAFDKLKIT